MYTLSLSRFSCVQHFATYELWSREYWSGLPFPASEDLPDPGIESISPVLVLKNLPANAGDIRDVGLIPGMGKSPGVRNGNMLQYSCLENPMDRLTWKAYNAYTDQNTMLYT